MKRPYIILALILLLLSNSLWAQNTKQQKKPNVLMIIADDMNGFGVNKIYPVVQTPHLDKLAKESINFKNAVCNSPVCNPSRSSFFSGLYPHTSGSYLNGSDAWNRSEKVKAIKSLPECFKENGYETWGRGKLTHSPVPEERKQQMWDNSLARNGGFGPFPEDQQYWYGGNKFKSVKAYEDDQVFPDVWNADSAVVFLEREHKKPFFMCYGLWRPHSPYTAPKRFFDLYNEEELTLPATHQKGDLDDVPFLGRMLVDSLKNFQGSEENPDALVKKFLYGYAANTSFADWNIGRVLEALDKSEYADNTIVILFSDNGFHAGSKQRWGKATLWDMADIVPMLVRMPDKKGSVSNATVSLVDLYPTLVEYCGISKPAQQMDGQSFHYLLENPNAKWDRPSFTSYGIKYSSVRSEQYRYIQYPNGTQELYDLKQDPYEFENIVEKSDMKEVIEYHQQFIPEKWAESTGGRLEVNRDFDEVMRELTPLHRAYGKKSKKKNKRKEKQK
ncbi:sulfatase [Limibacter armeniacum]|uniref:sulfatase n=1 Tax=Limibacter armeniacum TaxID=466084 RepID=UPI002FE63F58